MRSTVAGAFEVAFGAVFDDGTKDSSIDLAREFIIEMGVHYFHRCSLCQDSLSKTRVSKNDVEAPRFNPTTDDCGGLENERNIKCSTINFQHPRSSFD
jgi:hypothetical protein